MSATPTAVEIFCSYAHEDEFWRQKLETHLSVLKRQGLVSLWHHRLIVLGTDWAHAIDTHLETSSIILLLVSADFFASDYCYGIEMQHALKRHEVGESRVIPLLVRPVNWKSGLFAHLHALLTDARPLSTWQDEDTALTNVVADIRCVLEDLPLLAASTPRAALPAIWNIPYPRNPFFLGRESELAQVRQRLQAGQTTALSQPQAISGLGGIGKDSTCSGVCLSVSSGLPDGPVGTGREHRSIGCFLCRHRLALAVTRARSQGTRGNRTSG